MPRELAQLAGALIIMPGDEGDEFALEIGYLVLGLFPGPRVEADILAVYLRFEVDSEYNQMVISTSFRAMRDDMAAASSPLSHVRTTGTKD